MLKFYFILVTVLSYGIRREDLTSGTFVRRINAADLAANVRNISHSTSEFR